MSVHTNNLKSTQQPSLSRLYVPSVLVFVASHQHTSDRGQGDFPVGVVGVVAVAVVGRAAALTRKREDKVYDGMLV